MANPTKLAVAGQGLLGAEVSFPLRGAWTVEADLGAAKSYAALTGLVKVTLPGNVTLTGTVQRSGLHAGRGKAHVVGGAGGLGTTCSPRQFRNVTAETVLEAILGDGGESLSTTSTSSTLATALAMWTIPELSVTQAMDELTASLGASWRVLDNGRVWVGTEVWKPFTNTDAYRILDQKPGSDTIEIAPDILSLRPGVAFEGQRLSKVVYHIGPSSRRATAYLGEGRGGIDDTVRKIVRETLASQGLRSKTYSAKVLSQDADGTLQVKPDATTVPPMAGVPIRPGFPGTTLTVPAGARCFVRFADGDPSRPEVVGWETATALTLAVVGATGSADYVALAASVKSELDAIQSQLDSIDSTLTAWDVTFKAHVHTGVTTGPGSSGPTVTPGPAYTNGYSASEVAATKLKAE